MKKIYCISCSLLLSLCCLAQKYRFIEEFDDNRNSWEITNDSVCTTSIVESRYYFRNNGLKEHWNMVLYKPSIVLDGPKNYKVISKISCEPESMEQYYGLSFNADLPEISFKIPGNYEDSNFVRNLSRRKLYAFVLRKDGYATLFYSGSDRKYQQIAQWIKVKDVSSGANIFMIKNNGNHFTFYLNGKLVIKKNIDIPRGYSEPGFIAWKNIGMLIDYFHIEEY